MGVLKVRKKQGKNFNPEIGHEKSDLPSVSIVIPVKNEETVIGRLLKALSRIEYPSEKMEIIIVEDASSDNTRIICERFVEQYPHNRRFFHRSISNGKPSALNYGFERAKGDIVAIFDADNVPQPDVLLKATKYFSDASIAAVQGTTETINSNMNMLTKFISYEQAVWHKNYLRGKDELNLFVPLTGSCQFIRRSVAEDLGFWDENCLAEDLEMAAKITEKGLRIKYAPDAVSWQEATSSLKQMVRQRIRWFRGYMEVALKYGRLLRDLKRKSLDAEITLMGPFVLALFLLNSFLSFSLSFFPFLYDPFFMTLAQLTLALTGVTLFVSAVSLIYVSKSRNLRNLLWFPFIYAYWCVQNILATFAFFQIILRRPRIWAKTSKTGKQNIDSLNLP
jgi:cellulose synthase/poly-beta-1,6-N-acetylglucosamine synthase-like glycosyltransferase